MLECKTLYFRWGEKAMIEVSTQTRVSLIRVFVIVSLQHASKFEESACLHNMVLIFRMEIHILLCTILCCAI